MANYWLLWSLYIAAAACFIAIIWRVLYFKKHLLLTFCLRAATISILLTPWTSNVRDPYIAPALMVMTLDGITLGSGEAIRAFVPLLLSITTSIVVAVVLWWRKRRKLIKW